MENKENYTILELENMFKTYRNYRWAIRVYDAEYSDVAKRVVKENIFAQDGENLINVKKEVKPFKKRVHQAHENCKQVMPNTLLKILNLI